ncbi:MAG TPA: DUF1405 domain-containing protein [Symbiobacteriaceae bacterium]
MTAALVRFFHAVAHQRRFWWALLFVNAVGSVYGFWWYRYQLLETPRWQWPLVPDSPGATFLLMIWLALLLAGVDWRRPGMQVLSAVAFVANMKYGLWTAVVLPEAGIKYGWEWEFAYLTLSHLGMWLQGMLFAHYYPPRPAPAAVALLSMWFQDLVDYWILMIHPTLPYIAEFLFARNTAVILSTLWGGYLLVRAWFDRGRRAT